MYKLAFHFIGLVIHLIFVFTLSSVTRYTSKYNNIRTALKGTLAISIQGNIPEFMNLIETETIDFGYPELSILAISSAALAEWC